MMKINFKITKNYLITHLLYCSTNNLFSSSKYKKDIALFQNMVFKKNPKYFDFLIGFFAPQNISSKNIKLFLQDIKLELPIFLNQLQKSKEFKKIYKQTEKYLEKCKKEWNNNFDFTNTFIKELTGLNLNKTFTVYITHPSLKNGQYWGDNNITWGATEKWKNYSTTYIWHEILHSYFDKSDLSHVIIELIADEELRKNLNKGKYPPFMGHENLTELKIKILPFWKEYLKLKNKNIRKFQKLLQSQKIKNI